jgi:hypothetical protein
MKKLFFLLLFLALGGYIFFTGWVQFRLPAGSFAVIRSKTHGTDSRVVKDGEFRWVWYALIPTNAVVTAFKLTENAFPVHISGTLPSAETYAATAGIKADFSYEITGTVYCSLKPDSLPALAEEENLLEQAELDAWMRRFAGDAGSFVLERLWIHAEQEAVLEEIMKTGGAAILERELAERFPRFENWKTSLNIPHFPDVALYGEIKKLYQDFVEARQTLMNSGISDAALKNIQSRQRFEELSLYGELLTKYPILIEYLALENRAGQR